MNIRVLAPCAALVAALGAGSLLSACVPVVVGAAVVGGALVVVDRRSTGAQVDDESIEVKVQNSANASYRDIHLNVTSFNGIVLLSGEVPNQAAKDGVANIARNTDRVRSVQNELVVGPTSSIGQRSNDSVLTSKVKARFVEANEFHANHVKVVTERGVVYLMGIVSKQEAEAAARLAAQTSGVTRVVRLFEYT